MRTAPGSRPCCGRTAASWSACSSIPSPRPRPRCSRRRCGWGRSRRRGRGGFRSPVGGAPGRDRRARLADPACRGPRPPRRGVRRAALPRGGARARPLFGARDRRPAADYLASMRGLLTLARSTADSALWRDLEGRYRDLTQSTDVTAMGELPEVFGRPGPPDLSAGAGLLRVSLQLWDATAALEALDTGRGPPVEPAVRLPARRRRLRAPSRARGSRSPPMSRRTAARARRAQPYRAFRDVLDHLTRHQDQTAFPRSSGRRHHRARLRPRPAPRPPKARAPVAWSSRVHDAAPGPQGLALRKPTWATGHSSSSMGAGDGAARPYLNLQRRWRAGETDRDAARACRAPGDARAPDGSRRPPWPPRPKRPSSWGRG